MSSLHHSTQSLTTTRSAAERQRLMRSVHHQNDPIIAAGERIQSRDARTGDRAAARADEH
jgi:hypothetical protein